ncbi:hypothetical protein ACOSQ3_006678 [Xanthoceras sorbifolium]
MDPEEIARRCVNLSLSEGRVPAVKIDPNLQVRGVRELKMSLVGKIVTNKEVHRESFKAAITSIWKPRKGILIESLGNNIFIFIFRCLWDRKRIFEGGHWSFDKCLLVLKEANGVGKLSDLNFDSTPFWVQMFNLPLACMSREIGVVLGSSLGEVKEVDMDANGNCWGRCLRVRILMDISKPLQRGLKALLGDDGEEISVLLCYERLPNFCYYCGRVGHLLR